MKLAWLIERDGDAGAVFADDIAGDGQRLVRHRDGIGDGDDPARAVSLQAHQTRPLQLDAHDHFAVRTVREYGALDGVTGVIVEGADVDLGGAVEHQPQHVGTAEDGRWSRNGKWEFG